MENGKVTEEQMPGMVAKETPEGPAIVIDGAVVIDADYIELIKANPGLAQALTVVVQKRVIAEKDAEIAGVKAE